jgi:hypothetical protein
VRVALEQRQVARVRAPEDVADVAGNRHGADERVEQRVAHHAKQDDARDAPVQALHQERHRKQRADQVAQTRDEREDRIQSEADRRAGNDEAVVEQLSPVAEVREHGCTHVNE